MNLPDAPIAHEGFFATHFFTVSDQDKRSPVAAIHQTRIVNIDCLRTDLSGSHGRTSEPDQYCHTLGDDAGANHDDLPDHERHGHRGCQLFASISRKKTGKRITEKCIGTLGFECSEMRYSKCSVRDIFYRSRCNTIPSRRVARPLRGV